MNSKMLDAQLVVDLFLMSDPGAIVQGCLGEAEGGDGDFGGSPGEDEGSTRVDNQDLCGRER